MNEVGDQKHSPIGENARLKATIEILLRGKKAEHNEVNQDELP
jgi:hypothetical protein